MSSIFARTLFGVAIACGALVGCGDDSHDGALVTDDGGTTAPGDAGNVTAPASRKLVTVPLFDTGDVENRVSDPLIELKQWFFTDPQTGESTVQVNRLGLPASPGGQAALFIGGAAVNPRGVTFGVTFKLPSIAYTASLWIGAKEKAITGIFPAVITSDNDGTGTPEYFELTASAKEKDVVVDGIHWTRFTVVADAPKIAGWGYVYGGTDGSQDLYVAAPSVVAGTGQMDPIGHRAHPTAAPESALRFLKTARSRHPAPPKPAAR